MILRSLLNRIFVLVLVGLSFHLSAVQAPGEPKSGVQEEEQAGVQWLKEVFNPLTGAISMEAANSSYLQGNAKNLEQGVSPENYWRVLTVSFGQGLAGGYSEWLYVVPSVSRDKPSAVGLYPASEPASRYPLLLWTTVEGAVYYELEFLPMEPENPNGTDLSQQSLWSTREVYKNGYIADLSWFKGEILYWRVRALDFSGKPLGVFSNAQRMHVNTAAMPQIKPFLTNDLNDDGQAVPLYPVYAWIPIPGAAIYEVELCSEPPENPNGTTPSRYRIWHKKGPGYDIYDDTARIQPGTYYWRVRGFDEGDNPVGVYSDAGSFTVDLSRGNYAACFGDSITHGGGAISYSPADLEYNFETYLDFPVLNLGRSGDTSETMAARFVADVLPVGPQYLIVLGGTNSIRGGVAGQQVIRELMYIRDECEKNDIRPIFLTLPPINPEAISRAFGEEAAPQWREEMTVVNQFIRQQKYYIDIEPFLSDGKGLLAEQYAVDGLHPDIEAKKIIGKIINENWARVTR